MDLFTWNMKGRRLAVIRFLRRLMKGSSIACLQEAKHKRPWIKIALRGWNEWGYPTVPIYTRPNVKVLAAGVWHLSDAKRVGSRGAGPPVLKEKWASFILTEDGWVINVHLAPSIYIETRDKLHEEQIARLMALVVMLRLTGERVVVVGDFNAVWSHDNLKPLRHASGKLFTPGGKTHNKTGRRIDLVIGWGFNSDGAQIIKGPVKWDHNAVKVSLV